ncbi:MAG: helix-turn-helix domain-containing protein [Chthoniobacterales bacterium]
MIKTATAGVGHHAPRRGAEEARRNADERLSRQDLFFRLARYIVTMPPLRERRDDIPLLVEHFLRLFATEMGMTSSALEPAALELLLAYSFPGNVRELKNVIERPLIESGGSTIQARHIHLLQAVPRRQPVAEAHSETTADDLPLNLDEVEQLLIQRALDRTGGNVAEAARLLGVNRSRIYQRFSQNSGRAFSRESN